MLSTLPQYTQRPFLFPSMVCVDSIHSRHAASNLSTLKLPTSLAIYEHFKTAFRCTRVADPSGIVLIRYVPAAAE